ncbi:MAG TPA: helix-turn-helix domain-containing protein [Patescibacteria group bacterium]
MFRASSLIKNARLDRELELADISKKLKIPFRYLEAIEEEKKNLFPQEPYCSMIVKDYADFLGLNGQEILSLFRRDYEPKRKIKPKAQSFFYFTPRFTFIISVILFVGVFSFYLIFEYIKFNKPPELKVNWPSDLTAQNGSVEITGITDPEATIRVNQDLVIVDQNGNFQKKVDLTGSETKITIESKSPSGKTTVDTKTIKSSR